MYTHKRNKHNIIPVTGKQEIFKSDSDKNYKIKKFKYKFDDNSVNLRTIIDKVIKEYEKLCTKFYLNTNSTFYKPNYNYETDSFQKLLKFYQNHNLGKITIPKSTQEAKVKIDNLLAIYIIILIEVTHDNDLFDHILEFVFLFKEYLNIIGWDHMINLYKFGLYENLSVLGEFCSTFNCEEIPELVNDFVLYFLDIEDGMTKNKKELIDITQNFCYWLYINGHTNYKMIRLR